MTPSGSALLSHWLVGFFECVWCMHLYSSEEMEQSEDVLIFHIQSWKQSCKSVSTCNQKPETAMKLFDPSHLHLCQTLAPVFLKLFISRWYFRRHMFSRVGMRRVSCVFNWHLQIWHASDFPAGWSCRFEDCCQERLCCNVSLRPLSDRLVWQWRFVGIGGNLSSERWHLLRLSFCD